MDVDVAGEREPLEKLIVILAATLCERSVNVATPEDAVAVNVPCNAPVPPLRVAVMTVLLSSSTRFP